MQSFKMVQYFILKTKGLDLFTNFIRAFSLAISTHPVAYWYFLHAIDKLSSIFFVSIFDPEWY